MNGKDRYYFEGLGFGLEILAKKSIHDEVYDMVQYTDNQGHPVFGKKRDLKDY